MKYTLIVLVLFFVAGCSEKPQVVEHIQNRHGDLVHKVFIANHGWHTGIIIPSPAVSHKLPFLSARFGDVPYYEFGWGDKGFYQVEKVTASVAIPALFWPTDSVMHVVAVDDLPDKYFSGSEVIELTLSDSQLKSLNQFIYNSFFHNKNKDVIKLSKGLYGDSHFFQGEGIYYLFNTCNKWTAKGLRSAGFNISPTFKFTADSIMGYLQEHRRARQQVKEA